MAKCSSAFLRVWVSLIWLGSACSHSPNRSNPLDLTSLELPESIPPEVQAKFKIEAVGAGSEVKSSPKKGRKKSKAVFVYPNRRGQRDPIWVGEKFTYKIQYFRLSAGELELRTLPFQKLNHRKVYRFKAVAKSSPIFSLFYRLEDTVESYMDFEGLFSHRFHVLLDESKQRRDALELNDSEKKETFYWNRWEHFKNGFTETQETASIPAFAQDSLSALFYLRSLELPDGAVITVPVVSEGKSWDAVCTVLRREEIRSPLGKVRAIVLQPEMKFNGVLKKNGDSFLYLTDDERRIPLKLEAKVKVGTVVATLTDVELGSPPESASDSSELKKPVL